MASTVDFSNNVWILDTGATSHMCCYLHHMHDVSLLPEPLHVKFPNGDQATVTHTRYVHLHTISVVITDVLYFPTFTFNLLSVSKLSSQLQ